MKVISIRQPWVTLIALGEKEYETRSWQVKYRGILGIHASKNIDHKAFRDNAVSTILAKYGIKKAEELPTGVILAVCKLKACLKVEYQNDDHAILQTNHLITGKEFAFGDFSVGRYVWQLANVQQLPEMIEAKGKLGLWEYKES
ncbi:ASCH domain-containing protein [Heyndrickxia ginsengihumi]|uniref:ASCH domain-containing protein n=1 Tax=Heyndrickxia ginsengihumi TaxID=363870 RepID=A0A0A6VHM6_9BACI|nr:ASCH domain-containing protein [Heyndrickxia ginsengihumi]KHD86918.1 hypothetical protein NG54_00660 [Heyndrickxia ginsengihumi]MBE6182752.1 ASCH domain-containing protein [Bacillus sp. (in: firmicutes)]MCM3021935.1 ASCH domain-containing protein [Heyndrickxia ginsengihumi]NEY20850.1 ASCH domain-containing protein [Heyndrickxia ginsengihumi]